MATDGFYTRGSYTKIRLRLYPLHREIAAYNHKAGLLTSFHSQVPSHRLPAVAVLLEGHKGTYSCETVGDSHPVPFLIAFIRTLFHQIMTMQTVSSAPAKYYLAALKGRLA